jgi:Ni/Co efflux regulator RcnB
MKKTVCAILTAGALSFAMSLPATAQETSTAKLKRVQMDEHKEKHPEIEAAVHHLREAKNSLEHANHDFGGHRAKAIEHVNQALAECEQALSFDKK